MKTKTGYFTVPNSGPRRPSVPNSKITAGMNAAFSKAVESTGSKPGKIVDSKAGGEADKQKQVIVGGSSQRNRVVGF